MSKHRYRYNPANDYKKRKKGHVDCPHVPQPDFHPVKSESGKTMTKCQKCKGAYCIEDEKIKRSKNNDRVEKSFDDIVYDVQQAQNRKKFYPRYRR